ncbi:MAG: hypothetical protein WCL71_04065, partial [Deltaproteobacteria bacterium]
MAEFAEHKPFQTIFLHENLQLSAHPADRKYWEKMAASLKIKYADEKPDLIIAQYRQALSFMTSYGKEIFGDVPVLFAGLTVEGYDFHVMKAKKGIINCKLFYTFILNMLLRSQCKKIYYQ